MKLVYMGQTTEYLRFQYRVPKDFLRMQLPHHHIKEADFTAHTIFPHLGLNILRDFIILDLLTNPNISSHFLRIFLLAAI